MDRKDKHFTPEAVDEQIDRQGQDSQLPALSSDTQLLQELQHLYKEDESRLAHIWQRFTQQAQSRENYNRQPIEIGPYQQRKLRQQQQYVALSASRRTRAQRLGLLLAQLVAVIVIASVLAIPALIRYQATSLHPVRQTALTDHDLYMSNDQGVMRVDASTGQVRWMFPIPDYALGLPNLPVMGNGIVYAESQDSIYAIDEVTGLLRWSHTFQSQISPYPSSKARLVLAGNAIYVSVVFMEVDKLDATNGKFLHKYKPGLNTNIKSISIENNTLYAFGIFDMCALRLTDGALLWYRPVNQALGIPHLVHGVIYTVTSSDVNWPYVNQKSISYVQAFDATTGSTRWQSHSIEGSITDISITNEVIYGGAADGSVFAYDTKTGSQIWSKTIAEMGFSGLAAPQVEAGIIYMVAKNPKLSYEAMGIIALDASNGYVKWQYPGTLTEMKHVRHMFEPPMVQRGIIIVNDARNGQATVELYALINGTVFWHHTVRNVIA